MRELADAERIHRFMRALGAAADADGAAYLTGGTTAVLLGWRASTVDVDLAFAPETDALLRAVSRLKHELQVNVELVSPADFVPVAAGWEDRSLFAAREGRLSFYHYDPYSQALAKLERAHAQDLADVRAMVEHGLVEPERALRYFEEIEPALYRYPAVDGPSFRRRVEEAFGERA
ncbi:MAG: hypothetical protein H0T39_08735 [Actinobacteria bacterium]|nr:hypothetical protein [Actinomycetota bacterium]